jgi:hypothetical protein
VAMISGEGRLDLAGWGARRRGRDRLLESGTGPPTLGGGSVSQGRPGNTLAMAEYAVAGIPAGLLALAAGLLRRP